MPAGKAHAAILPPDFVVENAVPGPPFEVPTSLAFLPDGRFLVSEKRGIVWMIEDGVRKPTPVWSGTQEVLDNYDRGLLHVAVDPNYFANHYIYLLYIVDPDSNGVDDDDDAFGRLTRYQIGFSDSSKVIASSRTVLIGGTWREGFPSGSPSHSVGSIRFAPDSTMLVSCGDGAQFSSMDAGGQDPGLFLPGRIDPAEDIGAFRARWVGSLSGKVLRVDRQTGLGLASNPYYDGNPSSNRSKVWAYGLRNPFRFALRPGTGATDPSLGNPGTLYIGDVGWGWWEEIDVARAGGLNFGWPCHEGPVLDPLYSAATPTHSGCDSSFTFGNPAFETEPLIYWHHTDSTLSSPPGVIGNAAVGGGFYTGTRYPPAYRGRYFFADYARDWIRTMVVDSADQVLAVENFASGLDGPVILETDPTSGDFVYVAIYLGEIRRLRYVGTENNTPPIAVMDAYPQAGPSPLTVSFSAARSRDPEKDPLTYNWLFGDGYVSTRRDPSHTYAAQGVYQAVLTVSDGRGGIGRDTTEIVADITEFPTTPLLDAFNRPNGPLDGTWSDELGSMRISSGAVTSTAGNGSVIWTGAEFGPDQEAFITITDPSSGIGAWHDLYLKVQGDSRLYGCIRVRYDAYLSEVRIESFTLDEGWSARGGPLPMLLLPGDQLGARALPNGEVVVLKNGESVAMGSVIGTPYPMLGGHIGFGVENALDARLDDFGGGDYVPSNTRPEVAIVSPLDGGFFVEGDSLWLRCLAHDIQDPAPALQYHWVVDLHHNNHLHPASLTSDSAQALLVAQHHDDGTGVWYTVSVRVTDSGSLSDTARVNIYPEVDLWPSTPISDPLEPGTTAPAFYTFTLHNSGRMPASNTHWVLRAGAAQLAEGDTVVKGRDSVVIRRTVAPVLSAGHWTLRATADSLGALPETDESNNAAAVDLTVINGPGSDEHPPIITWGPISFPSGDHAIVRWRTNELATGRVRWGATPALGDTAYATAETEDVVTIENLVPGTRYYYQVTSIDLAGNTTLRAQIDTFTTRLETLEAADLPLQFSLSQARPNPSVGRVSLALELPARARVEMRVLDVAGREVWHDSERDMTAGRWSLEWPGAAVARPGLYLARIMVDGRAHVRRVIVLR